MTQGQEFKNYATKHLNLSGTQVDDVIAHQVTNNMTPYIIEEREMRMTQMDVFSRLMMDRIIWVSGGVDDRMADIIEAQLMFLETINENDITLQLSTPGGSVMHGLGIRDVMNYVSPDIKTINMGMCASMGSILLSSGTKGKRCSLINSRVMTHMVSHGTQGNVQDTRIGQIEAEKYNYLLFKILAQNCDKTFEEMYASSTRDKWFNSDEALQFGLIDEIIGLDKHKSITTMMEGFDDYYIKYVMNK